jgi:glycosyltransferase involved in cell wall biosynthesis
MTQSVLMVVGDYPPVLGGIADYSRRLATALDACGVRVTVLTGTHAACPAESREGQVSVLRTMEGWRLRDAPALLRAVDRMGERTVVHIQYPAVAFRRNPMINLLPALLRRSRPGLPVAVTVHDARVMRRRWRARVAPMLAAAEAVIHVDAPDGPYLQRWTWRNRPVTACIPIGASIPPVEASAADRQAWRAALGLPGPEPVVSFFGMMYPHKGLPELVAAVERVRASGTPLRLLVIGDFDRATPFERTVGDLFREGMERGWLVWLRGADEEGVSRALWSADLAALPFHSGAASNRSSLLSSLAHGLPTVTTRGPATPEGFEEQFPVRMVPVRDAAALARAIQAELEVRPDAQGDLTRRSVSVIPSWEEVAAQHAELYAHLTAQDRAAA